jgi:hypothetical protein
MVSLLWNFYREVVVYHPMDAATKTQTVSKKDRKQVPEYTPSWDTVMVDKNLFSKARGYVPTRIEPKPDDEERIETPPMIPPDLRLNGIILDQYGEFIAVIQVGNEKPKRARKGDVISEALVVDISTREVKLLWNDQEINLSMKKIQTVPRTK